MNFYDETEELKSQLLKSEIRIKALENELEDSYISNRCCATLGGIAVAVLVLCFDDLKELMWPTLLLAIPFIIIGTFIGKILIVSIAQLLLRYGPSDPKKLADNTFVLSVVFSVIIVLYILFS